MSEDTNYPRCKTCDHWERDVPVPNDFEGRVRFPCEKGIEQVAGDTWEDFGCTLHSDMNSQGDG